MRFHPLRRPRGATKTLRAVRPVLFLLEDRTVLSATAQQQYLLELTNRMRTNPAGELGIDVNVPAVQQEMARAGTDMGLLQQQWATLTPAPPLAWSDALAGTSGYQSQYMNSTGQFGHNLPGEPTFQARLNGAGYFTGGENIYYGPNDLQAAHAMLAVEPQPGAPGGLLPGVGHRVAIMNPGYTQMGAGFTGQAGTGALFLTEDFGAAPGNPFLLGVAYRDADGNNFYGIGEGLGGVTVTATGAAGTFQTTTWDSGGYQMQLPAGTYTVTFSGGALGATQARTVVVGGSNVKVDAVAGAASAPAPPPAPAPAPTPAPVNPRYGVALSLTTSAEYYGQVVTAAYQKYLGRSPEASGLQYWVNNLRAGMRVEQFEAALASSGEYISRQGGVGATWVRALYRDVLGRTASQAEVDYWVGQFPNYSPFQIAYSFANSDERLGQRVAGYYQTFLGRQAGAGEIQYWVNQIHSGLNGEQVAAGFLASDEFYLNHGSNKTPWVTAAYWSAFGRAPEASALSYWTGLV